MRGCVDLADPTAIFLCKDCPEKYGSVGCELLRANGTKVVTGLKEENGGDNLC